MTISESEKILSSEEVSLRVKINETSYADVAELADALDSGFYTIFDEFPICRNIPKRLAFSAEKRCAVDT